MRSMTKFLHLTDLTPLWSQLYFINPEAAEQMVREMVVFLKNKVETTGVILYNPAKNYGQCKDYFHFTWF